MADFKVLRNTASSDETGVGDELNLGFYFS